MPRSRNRLKTRERKRKFYTNPLAVDRMFDKAVDAAFRRTSPRILYHYTSWAGAEGILRSQRFWATAHDCTNDDAELRSADAIIVEVARDLRKNAKGAAAVVLDLFLSGYESLQITQLTTIYLSCFSLARDDEEQWRKYGDKGRGVCLGIRVVDEPSPKYTDRGTAIIQVDYSESSWRVTLSEDLRKIYSVMKGVALTNKNLELGLFALHRTAAFASIGAKKEKWAVEQEYRHVTLLHKVAIVQPHERVSGDRLIRFLPVAVRADGKRIALAEIMVGPNQDVGEARQRLRQLLADIGYRVGDMEYPEISASATSPWAPSLALGTTLNMDPREK